MYKNSGKCAEKMAKVTFLNCFFVQPTLLNIDSSFSIINVKEKQQKLTFERLRLINVLLEKWQMID